MASARLGGAVGDAQRRLVEDDVAAVRPASSSVPASRMSPSTRSDAAAGRALRRGCRAGRGPCCRRRRTSAWRPSSSVDDVRADEAGAAGDQDTLVRQITTTESRSSRSAKLVDGSRLTRRPATLGDLHAQGELGEDAARKASRRRAPRIREVAAAMAQLGIGCLQVHGSGSGCPSRRRGSEVSRMTSRSDVRIA